MSFHHSELFSNYKIMESLLTICSLLVCVMAPGPSADYCFVPRTESYYRVHYVCQRLHSCPKPKNCEVYEANESWRQTMLDTFNDARNAVAKGTKKFHFGNPGAKKMNALSYDMELEYIATCYVSQCDTKNHYQNIIPCLDSARFPTEYFGVVVYSKIEFGMRLWTSPIFRFDGAEVKFNARTDEGVKYINGAYHWSNVYSWKVQYLGCSAMRSSDSTVVYCIVGPLNNRKSDIVYRVAKQQNEIASECENGRNGRYRALCGNIEEVPAEKMWTHQNITFNSSKNIVRVNSSFKIIMISIIVRIIFEVCE